MKAIETEYKGYRFRSRLEARWAVFFDACGVKWEYEPEGFDLGNGLYYLPDFLLHDVYINHGGDGTARYFGDLWIEVKGQMTDNDAKKIIKFANVQWFENVNDDDDFDYFKVEHPILVVANIPENLDEPFDLAYNGSKPYLFNFQLIDDDCFGACPCINGDGHFTLVGHDGNYTADRDDKATDEAYRLARQARFEHGEAPTAVKPVKPQPTISIELELFLKDKVVYMYNYDNIRYGNPTQSKFHYEENGQLDINVKAFAELRLLEKAVGTVKIMRATNDLIGISSEFRCALIDALWDSAFKDEYRCECARKFTDMVREEIVNNN